MTTWPPAELKSGTSVSGSTGAPARQPIWHFAQKIAAINVVESAGSPVAIS
jgi:hypothetical protein